MEQRSDTSKVVGSSPIKTTRIKMLYSSMVEQWFHKPQVAGSIPAKATKGVSCTKAGEFALQANCDELSR